MPNGDLVPSGGLDILGFGTAIDEVSEALDSLDHYIFKHTGPSPFQEGAKLEVRITPLNLGCLILAGATVGALGISAASFYNYWGPMLGRQKAGGNNPTPSVDLGGSGFLGLPTDKEVIEGLTGVDLSVASEKIATNLFRVANYILKSPLVPAPVKQKIRELLREGKTIELQEYLQSSGMI